MSLRLIEVIFPVDRLQEFTNLMNKQEVFGIWTTELGEEQAIVRVLVPLKMTETVTDVINQHFEHSQDFRLMLFAVEATVPVPEEETKEPSEEESDEKEKQPERISREELYQDIATGAHLNVTYVVTVLLSTIVAAIGILRNDVAIIIGAMVIAPLLGPNVALALGSTLGDVSLISRATRTLLVGIGAAAAASVFIGLITEVNPDIPAILNRTRGTVADMILALVAGSAGALAFTSGIPAAVIGVMVAVALLPPLVITGLLLGSGYYSLAMGSLILLMTNVASINLSGVITFFVQKIRPRSYWEAEGAKKATRTALIGWILTLVFILVMIFVVD